MATCSRWCRRSRRRSSRPGKLAATDIRIRAPRASDREDILALVPRLRAFGPSELRRESDLDRAEMESLSRALDVMPEGAAVLVAECDEPSRGVAGVAYVETATDYFTRERHGHLGILSVSAAAEGRGVGRALLAAVERWANERGYRFLTLNVFSANARARRVYELAGFTPDTVRYAKVLRG